jgi:putative ABC transport system permease protein
MPATPDAARHPSHDGNLLEMNLVTLPVRSLVGRPIRSALTVLGIAVAMAGFIALTGLTEGALHSFASGIDEPGGDLVVTQRNGYSMLSSSVPESLGKGLSTIEGVDAVSGVLLNITTAEDEANVVISGWSPDSFMWGNLHLASGHAPSASEPWGAVLGESIAKALGKKLGDTIELQFQPYTIVGIAVFDTVLNQNIAIVPIAGLQELLGRDGTVTLFQVRLKRPLDPDRAASVRARLANASKDFAVTTTSEFAGNLRFFRLIQAITATVSVIVLTSAVLAIANTMLMAVGERTFELGILASIGWRPSRILALILIEGFAISLIGGVIGLGLGILAMHVASWSRLAAGLLEPYLSSSLGLQALVAVLVAGPLGALYPAWRATRLLPAEALRRQ